MRLVELSDSLPESPARRKFMGTTITELRKKETLGNDVVVSNPDNGKQQR